MATCTQCGTANVTGRFCPNCGAPVATEAQPTASAMPTPAPGPAPYRPPVQPGYQGPVPTQPYPGGVNPPPPPKKSNALVIVIAAVAGVAVLGVGAWALFLREPASPAVGPGPTPPVANNGNTPTPQPDPTPPPPKNDQPTGNNLAKVVAQGRIDFTNFVEYDAYGGKQFGLVRNDGEYLQAKVFEYRQGNFELVLESAMPMGQATDINHGPIFNNGKDYILFTAEKGVLLAPEDGDFTLNDAVSNVYHALIGDWDGDGTSESLEVIKNGDQFQFEIWQYKPGEKGQVLSKPDPLPIFLTQPQAIRIPGEEQSFLMGWDTVSLTDALPLTIYTVDLETGFEAEVGLAIHQKGNEVIQGYAVGSINGEAALAVTYTDGNQSYLELFDLLSVGGDTYAPPKSLGKMQLPDNGKYAPMFGQYTGTGKDELLTVSLEGNWYIYGF